MTTTYYVDYPLSEGGYIHNWLVAGPYASPVNDLASFTGDDVKSQIAHKYHTDDPGIAEPAIHFAKFIRDDVELRWDYIRCEDDHFVDLSTFHHTAHFLQAWASTDLISTVDQAVDLIITTNGPADIWINGQHVHRHVHFHHQQPKSVPLSANLSAGQNTILIRFEAVALRECPYVMALQLIDFSLHQDNPVRIPIAVDATERYHSLEQVFQQAYLERDVYVHDDHITIRWPKGMTDSARYTVRLTQPPRIYAELQEDNHNGSDRPIMKAFEAVDGPYEVQFLPNVTEFYEQNVRMQRSINIQTVRNKFADAPTDNQAQRRSDALRDAAMRNTGLYSEIAKMQGGWWENLKPQAILDTIDDINQRRDCSDFYLVGLIGMLYRFGDHENFPEDIKQPIEDCILNFRYWLDQPGDDAMCFWSENHQILFHTCEMLAGQQYPEQIFGNSQMTGQQHRENGEQLALAWLKKRGEYGFQEWDSNCYFEHDILALSHILDLSDTEEVWEMAALIMDKIFLTMALNSYKGVFGSTHGRSYTAHIKGGYLEPTAGLGRLMWGQGIYNHHIMGTVAMACCDNYDLPAIIANIATDLPVDGMWSKERHAGEFNPAVDLRSGTWEVNKVTYKTADYMLCSAQDYHPGEPGYQQHIWQATLGPDAVVFVNHPPGLNEDGAHRPGAWHGNVVLPRTAQWKDVLISIHNLPDDDWLGFTHAYVPRYAFDEFSMEDGWAFVCKDDGYLALTSSQGLRLTTRGQNAYRELRSYGLHTVWVCQMGRKSEDGDFKSFKNKVLKASLTFDDLSVNYTSLRNQTITFGWESDFFVDNEIQPLKDFKHYDGPYAAAEWPAKILAMGYDKQLVRLNLGDENN